MGSPGTTLGWGLVVPVKPLSVAKTRLGAYGDELRAELALAFALDVVAAVRDCPAVVHLVVVTDDERVAAAVAGARTGVVPDGPGAGHNPALRHGAELLRSRNPEAGVAALSSDLPALRPDDLTGALAQVPARGFVADASGAGTTLLAAAPGHELAPAYGPGSRDRHLASGAVQLAAPPTLARDVDTPADLLEALRLGVGPRTAAVAARLG